MLKSTLHGCAKDLCAWILSSIFASKRGTDAIVAAFHKKYPGSFVTRVYWDLYDLTISRRDPSQLVRSYEGRFTVQISKFCAQLTCVILLAYILALLLFSNAELDSWQRIFVLSLAVAQGKKYQHHLMSR